MHTVEITMMILQVQLNEPIPLKLVKHDKAFDCYTSERQVSHNARATPFPGIVMFHGCVQGEEAVEHFPPNLVHALPLMRVLDLPSWEQELGIHEVMSSHALGCTMSLASMR